MSVLKSLKNCQIRKVLWFVNRQKNSDKEYGHVLKVWNTYQMKTVKDYHNLYLKFYVLLVAVFGKFRNSNLNNDWLCPSHYLNAPALSWDAMQHKS